MNDREPTLQAIDAAIRAHCEWVAGEPVLVEAFVGQVAVRKLSELDKGDDGNVSYMAIYGEQSAIASLGLVTVLSATADYDLMPDVLRDE